MAVLRERERDKNILDPVNTINFYSSWAEIILEFKTAS